MLEIIILDGRTFKIKDYTFSNDYVLLFDSLVQNASTFNVTKLVLNASSDDIVITRGKQKLYMGVIDNITTNNNIVKITTYQFSKKFDISYLGESQTNINLGDYIKKIIEDNLVNSDDDLQNINYLEVENKTTITGAVSLTSNSTSNILTVISSILKGYELLINYSVVYNSQGGIKSIKVLIEDVKKELVIKETENFITNVNVVDGRIGAVNKLIYYPNSDNVLYKETLKYYLLQDGSVSTDANAEGRLLPVIPEGEYYQDADIYYDAGATLLAKVKEKFASTTYNHSISFTINNNKAINPNTLNLGDRVYFLDKDKKLYKSIITKLRYTNLGDSVEVDLGLNRTSLTDKLAMKKE